MRLSIGTKSVLFGVHQFAIHPWFVALAWWKLYGFPFDLRLWVAFFLHDIGYFGKPNMDGPEGETHPVVGAQIISRIFDDPRSPLGGRHWYFLCLLHSRFYSKKLNLPFSRLCVADKLAIALTPAWLYLRQAKASGELHEYMRGTGARTPAGQRTPEQWFGDVQRYCGAWAWEHRDGRDDTWTGTKRDLLLNVADDTDKKS